MPLSEKLLLDGGVNALVTLIRYIVTCTIVICVTIFGWAITQRDATQANTSQIQTLSTLFKEHTDHEKSRIDRNEARLDNL